MIVTLTLAPALDKTAVIPGFAADRVNRVQSLRLDAGGKGINVSKVLRALGTDSLATGILGGSTGRFIEGALKQAGIACDFAWVEQDTRTNMKVIDPENHTNTDINEPGAPAAEAVLESVWQKAADAAKPGDIVVLAGKAPTGTRDTLFAEWITQFKTQRIQVYMDADAGLLIEGVKACPALIKPNDAELERLTGEHFENISQMAEAAKQLNAQGIETVIVSLGGDGALFARDGQVLRCQGLKVPVQSTVGAGDSMVAAMAHGAASGMTFRETCALAMAVSAASVMMPGTQSPEVGTVRQLLQQVKIEAM